MVFVALTGVDPCGRISVAAAGQRLVGLHVLRLFREVAGNVHPTAGLRAAAVGL